MPYADTGTGQLLHNSNVEFLLVKLCGIPLRAISLWVPKLLF